MNKDRRKRIGAIIKKFEEAFANVPSLEDFISDLEEIKEEEQEAYDNLPESLQGGEKGSAMEQAISNLEEAIEHLQELATALENSESICDLLSSAME